MLVSDRNRVFDFPGFHDARRQGAGGLRDGGLLGVLPFAHHIFDGAIGAGANAHRHRIADDRVHGGRPGGGAGDGAGNAADR